MRYNEKIAAQVAAYFIYREGGRLNIMKLIKLMYLAERESLKQYGEPITGDELVSMNYGPVMSVTLDHINGAIPSVADGWDSWINDIANRCVSSSVDGDPVDSLDELSDADIDILIGVYKKFGSMSQFQLSDYTHQYCAEWEHPHGSSSPIPYTRLLKNTGYSPETAAVINQRIEEQTDISNILSNKAFQHAAN